MVLIELTGPRGDNPLGFLTALGALVALEDAGWNVRLAWRGLTPGLAVDRNGAPDLYDHSDEDRRSCLIAALHSALRRDRTDNPDPSVSLGDDLNQSHAQFLNHVDAASRQATASDRRWVDLVAAFGIGDPAKLHEPKERMAATPWALVSGSGHQHFLASVAKLMVECRPNHLEQALFGPWSPRDEKYSLRLDIDEDRRYALMDRDPTASGNKPRTLWGANRLAFEGLRVFPVMPAAGGMAVRAWRLQGGSWREGCAVRWPLWCPPISAGVVGSLLGLSELWLEDSSARERLRALGVFAVYESRRIAVGEGGNVKYNLTPPVAIWRS